MGFNNGFNPPASDAGVQEQILFSDGGYEFTGGFEDRVSGSAGSTDIGSTVSYTIEQAQEGIWRRFGFTRARHIANDQPYWTDPSPASATDVGLFGGSYMPNSVTNLYDFEVFDPNFSVESTGSLKYTAASGSLDFSQCKTGDLLLCRFDLNIIPQEPSTIVEVGLIWQTRASDGTPTFTFSLTTQPITFGSTGVGETFLARPLISAYFASNEDIRAMALPAIRSNNQVRIEPLTLLTTIVR
jgi:hypothetical protein